ATSVVATALKALAAWSHQNPIRAWTRALAMWPTLPAVVTRLTRARTAAATLSHPTRLNQKESVLICTSAAAVNGIRRSPPGSDVTGFVAMTPPLRVLSDEQAWPPGRSPR